MRDYLPSICTGSKNTSPAELQAETKMLLATGTNIFTSKIESLHALVVAIDALDIVLKAYAQQHYQSQVTLSYTRNLVNDMLRTLEVLVDGLGFAWPGADKDSEAAPDENSGVVADASVTKSNTVDGLVALDFNQQSNVNKLPLSVVF